MPTHAVYAADRRLARGDIGMAISEYEAAKGRLPEVIIIHPKNETRAGEAPEGIQVEYMSNILLSEVWFPITETPALVDYGPVGDEEPPPNAVIAVSVPNNGCTKTKHDESHHPNQTGVVLVHPGGRPPAVRLPMNKISKLVGRGLSTRKIADRLKLSHGTTQRAIKRLQMPLLIED